MKKYYFLVVMILITSIVAFSLDITARSPVNNAENVDIRNIFRWNISEENDYNYNLYLSTEKDISEKDLIISNLFSNFYAGNILKPDTEYYWQIEAIKENQSYKSNIFHFKTRPLEDGDIFEIIYGDYEQIEFFNDFYLGIKSKTIDILNKAKKIIKSFSLNSDFKKITFYKDSALFLDINGEIYSITNQELKQLETEKNFKDIQNNILLAENGLYYLDNGEIKEFIQDENISKIKTINKELFVIYEDKIEKYSETLEILNEADEEKVIDIFFFEDGYLLLKNEKIFSINNDLKRENELEFNVNFEKLNRKIQTSNGYLYILSGKDILSIYNEQLERIKSINLDFKTDYIISDRENFILIGESIKAQNINGDTFWSYGTLNEMEIFSSPIIKEDSFLIGVSDYLKRHLFFYNDFTEKIDSGFIKTNTYYQKIEKEEIEKEDQDEEEIDTQDDQEDEIEQEKTTEPSTPTEQSTPTETSTPTIQSTTTELATEIITDEKLTFESSINNIEFTYFPTITSTPEDLLEDEFTFSSTTIEDEMEFTIDATETQIDIITEKSTITETLTITEDATITDIATITDVSTKTEKLTDVSTESTVNLLENMDFEFYYEYVDYIEEMYNSLKNGVSGLLTEEKIVEQTKIIEKNEDIYVYDVNIDKNATETTVYLSGYKDNGVWNNLVIKLDKNLEDLQEKVFGGDKTDFIKKSLITKDASNNTVILSVGDTSSEGLNGDVSVLSMDATLNHKYSMNYGDIGRDSGINIKDYDGENFIIMGNLYQNNKLTDMFISKYTNNGSRLWTSAFGGKSIEIANDFSVDNQENILALGSTRSFGYGGFDIYVVKTDFYGNEIWSNTFGTSDDDLPVGIQSISGNRFLISYQAQKDDYFENRFMVINSEGNIINQFSTDSDGYEKLLGIEEYKNNYYVYGFKREKEKTKGIIYTIDIDNNEMIKEYEIDTEMNFEIRAIDFHDDLIYIAGNEFDEEKNRILILKKKLKGDK